MKVGHNLHFRDQLCNVLIDVQGHVQGSVDFRPVIRKAISKMTSWVDDARQLHTVGVKQTKEHHGLGLVAAAKEAIVNEQSHLEKLLRFLIPECVKRSVKRVAFPSEITQYGIKFLPEQQWTVESP